MPWVTPWAALEPWQRELAMRIGSAVAVRAVADARADLTARNREIVRLRAELDALEKHRPAAMGALMTEPTNQWPAELIQWVRGTPGPFCGDALADAVAGWVRSQP